MTEHRSLLLCLLLGQKFLVNLFNGCAPPVSLDKPAPRKNIFVGPIHDSLLSHIKWRDCAILYIMITQSCTRGDSSIGPQSRRLSRSGGGGAHPFEKELDCFTRFFDQATNTAIMIDVLSIRSFHNFHLLKSDPTNNAFTLLNQS